MDRLSKLAWNGFCQKQIVFEENDFKQVELDEITVRSFLHTSLVDTLGGIALAIMDRDKTIYFSRLIWQEFFVAVYLMLVDTVDNFKQVHQRLFDDQWEVVAQCLYGLCNATTIKLIKRLTNIPFEARLWKEKKELLSDAAASYLLKQRHGEANKNEQVEYDSIRTICSWIHEANDLEINKKLIPLISDHICFGTSIVFPSDVSNLFFVQQSSSKPWTLEVRNCKFRGNAMKRFCLEAFSSKTKVGQHFYWNAQYFEN